MTETGLIQEKRDRKSGRLNWFFLRIVSLIAKAIINRWQQGLGKIKGRFGGLK
jgi:hypothetical protein